MYRLNGFDLRWFVSYSIVAEPDVSMYRTIVYKGQEASIDGIEETCMAGWRNQ